jgi:hypothetical protein
MSEVEMKEVGNPIAMHDGAGNLIEDEAARQARHRQSQATIGVRGLTGVRGSGLSGKCKYLLGILWSIVTARFLSKNMARNIENSEEMYDSLQNQWATVALVSALLMSIAAGFNTVEVGNPEHCAKLTVGAYTCQDVHGILLMCIACLYMLSLLMVVLFVMMLNTIPKSMTSSFVYEFKLFMGIPEFFMLAGTIFCIVDIEIWFYLTYTGDIANFLVTIGIVSCGGVMLALQYMVLVLDKENGIWERSSALNSHADGRTKAMKH